MLAFHVDPRDPSFGTVTAQNVALPLLFAYPGGGLPMQHFLEAAFHVEVTEAGQSVASSRLVAGHYEAIGKALRFRPESPLAPGVQYRATLDFRSSGGLQEALTLDFAVPELQRTNPAMIRNAYLMTGASPNTTWLRGCVALDDKGFVLTGVALTPEHLQAANWPHTRKPYLLETSIPGVFAVGDVRANSVKRVASGVGEGSLAINFVHKALAE